ncbi:MAG: VanZ family protein [Oscillospiraceae bacterium]|nr:VanZ family protein [Oscillospiraceae bacterium]
MKPEKFLVVVLILLTLAFIWGNSMLDGNASEGLSRGLLDHIKPLLDALGIESDSDKWLRKLAHFCEFALLGAEFCMYAFLEKSDSFKKRLPLCAVLAFAVAAIDETIQRFSGRFPHILDVLLDFSGSLFGIICMYFLLQLWMGKKNKI